MADATVHAGHHAGKRSDRIANLCAMTVLTYLVFELRKLFPERSDILLRALHSCVRDGDRQVGEERFLSVIADEFQCVILDEIVRIGFAVEHHLAVVMPEVLGIKRVCLALAVIAKKLVPTLVYRITARPWRTESPLAEHASGVAGFFK